MTQFVFCWTNYKTLRRFIWSVKLKNFINCMVLVHKRRQGFGSHASHGGSRFFFFKSCTRLIQNVSSHMFIVSSFSVLNIRILRAARILVRSRNLAFSFVFAASLSRTLPVLAAEKIFDSRTPFQAVLKQFGINVFFSNL